MDKETLKMKLDDYETFVFEQCKSRDFWNKVTRYAIVAGKIISAVLIATGLESGRSIVGAVLLVLLMIYQGRYEKVVRFQKNFNDFKLEIDTIRDMIEDNNSYATETSDIVVISRVIENPELYIVEELMMNSLWYEYNERQYEVTGCFNHDEVIENNENVKQIVAIRFEDAIKDILMTSIIE